MLMYVASLIRKMPATDCKLSEKIKITVIYNYHDYFCSLFFSSGLLT